MTVLHRGLAWPTWNPGRFFTAYYGRLSYPPTALRWDVDNWSGIIGAGAITGSSDWLPSVDPSNLAVRYSKILFGILGNSFEIRVTVGATSSPSFNPDWNVLEFRILQGGVDQVRPFGWQAPAAVPWSFDLTTSGNLFPAPDAVAYPTNHFNFSAVPWGASPPPPASSPF